MKKPTAKQLDVIWKCYINQSFIVLLKGPSPKCFLRKVIDFKLSIATLYAMEGNGFLEAVNDKWNCCEYHLTERAIEIAKSL